MLVAEHGIVSTTARTAPPARVHRPRSVDEALALLAAPGAVAVAGGTDLCAQYNEGRMPASLVSLDRLDAPRRIEADDAELRIGALVTHAEGGTNDAVRAFLPGFADAWPMLANVRVRFRATIGGNLMARRTRYEMSVLLTALDARLRFAVGGGFFEASTDDVWEGRVPSPALLHHVAIPRRAGARFSYQRSLRPSLTVAVSLHDGGGRAAVATEMLRPVALPADDVRLDGLPAAFADAAISHWYARRAGSALLRRGVEACGG